MSGECNVSSDCDELFDDGVLRHCYTTASFSDETDFCDCPNWYGWGGDTCDELTTQLMCFRTYLIFTTSTSTVLMLAYLLCLAPSVQRITENVRIKLLYIIAGFFFMTLILSLVTTGLVFPSAYDPELFERDAITSSVGDDRTVIQAEFATESYVTQILALAFAQFGNMSIILSWINVLKTTARVFPHILSRRTIILSNLLKGYLIAAAMVLLICTIISNHFLLGIAATVMLLSTLVFYSYFTLTFIASIKTLSFKKPVFLVRNSFRAIFFCIWWTLGALLGSMISSREYETKLDIGQFNPGLFFQYLVVWLLQLNTGFALWYVYWRIQNILLSMKPTSSQGTRASSNFEQADMTVKY